MRVLYFLMTAFVLVACGAEEDRVQLSSLESSYIAKYENLDGFPAPTMVSSRLPSSGSSLTRLVLMSQNGVLLTGADVSIQPVSSTQTDTYDRFTDTFGEVAVNLRAPSVSKVFAQYEGIVLEQELLVLSTNSRSVGIVVFDIVCGEECRPAEMRSGSLTGQARSAGILTEVSVSGFFIGDFDYQQDEIYLSESGYDFLYAVDSLDADGQVLFNNGQGSSEMISFSYNPYSVVGFNVSL